MTHTEAYRNGWLAEMKLGDEAPNPYDPVTQCFSYEEWQRGHRDRANTAPGAHLEGILNVGMMKP